MKINTSTHCAYFEWALDKQLSLRPLSTLNASVAAYVITYWTDADQKRVDPFGNKKATFWKYSPCTVFRQAEVIRKFVGTNLPWTYSLYLSFYIFPVLSDNAVTAHELSIVKWPTDSLGGNASLWFICILLVQLDTIVVIWDLLASTWNIFFQEESTFWGVMSES